VVFRLQKLQLDQTAAMAQFDGATLSDQNVVALGLEQLELLCGEVREGQGQDSVHWMTSFTVALNSGYIGLKGQGL
jgi:hypothetical protein